MLWLDKTNYSIITVPLSSSQSTFKPKLSAMNLTGTTVRSLENSGAVSSVIFSPFTLSLIHIYNTVAYNIDDNNYFKLRDIAKILDGTIKGFDIKYDGATNSIDMLSFYDYTSAGGELTPGDGVERTAL